MLLGFLPLFVWAFYLYSLIEPGSSIATFVPSYAQAGVARIAADGKESGDAPNRWRVTGAGIWSVLAPELLIPAAQLPCQRLRGAAEERLPGDIASSWRHVGGRPVLHPRVERQFELHAARIVGKKLPQSGAGHDELPVGKSMRG